MKKVITILLTIVFIFSFASIANAQITKDQYYARSTLAGNELEFYDHFYESLNDLSIGYEYDNYGLTNERAAQIFNFVCDDSPECINNWDVYSNKEVEELLDKANAIANEIISGLDNSMTDYEKVKAIYIAVGKHIYYGRGTIEKDDKAIQESQTIVGGLINRKAVCAGISSTLQYLLYKIDIPCYCVDGTTNGTLHRWNLIQIDGKWYHADLTRDIANVKRGDLLEGFLISDDTLHSQGTYANADNPLLPECPSDYIEPQPTPTPTPQPTYEPVHANTPEPQGIAAETFAKPENSTDYTLWYVLGGAAVAAVLIVLAVRKKKKA